MEGDEVVFERSVASNEDTVLFSDKKYNFIVDSTSNSGVFPNGQIQFNLKTLSSQSQWTSLAEAVIEFPIKITAKITTAATTSATVPTGAFAGVDSVINKCGFHQWVNSAQMIIGGQTIQSFQQYENIAATYRILSSWSQDTLKKWGTTTGVALDDMTGDSTGTTATVDTVGLSNAALATVATAARGLDVVNNQASLANRGVVARAKLNNNSASTLTVANGILGSTAMLNCGLSNVATYPAVATTITPLNTFIYVQYMMGTVRLKDIFDINQFPVCKNLDGYVYVNFNSATTVLTGTASGSTFTNTLASAATTTNFGGLTCPYLLNVSAAASATNGINFSAGTGATGATAEVITVVGTIDGTTTALSGTNIGGGAAPLLTQARLVVPYYIATPRVDEALTKHDHRFCTYEKQVNPINVAAGQPINYIITVGVPNPRKLVLLPMWCNLGGATLPSPELSPFDSVPASSGPYAYLNQLQVYIANKPLFQYPINYDFEMWNNEISALGMNGQVANEMTSGLLSQQLWTQNHRYYAIDLERRMVSEDGASKSVQVSFVNPSSSYALKVIAIVFYEKHWTISTDICKLSSYA